MASEIPDLWSDQIKVDVRTPTMILNYQVDKLKQRTQGILIAELVPYVGPLTTQLQLDLVAPAAQNTRIGILIAKFKTDEVYPTMIAGAGIERLAKLSIQTAPDHLVIDGVPVNRQFRADTEEELIEAVATVLKSPTVLSKIQSLIARSNETINPARGVKIQNEARMKSEDQASGAKI